MLDKYFKMEENNEAGQNSSGIWYCKKLLFKDERDLEYKINQVNKVLNRFNEETKKKIEKEKKVKDK
jgi:hypothetical protein